MGKAKRGLRHRSRVGRLVDPDFRWPIFKAPGQLDCCRFRSDLEYIVSDEFPRWTPKTVSGLAAKAGSGGQRIHERHKTWIIDRHWRQWNDQNRGVHHRVFTPEEEGAIKEFIVAKYVIPGVSLTNDGLHDVAIWAFLEKHSDIGTSVPFFNLPVRFILGIKLQNGLSSQSCHLKRRAPPVSAEIKSLRPSDLGLLLREQPRDRTLNWDETCWQVDPNGLKPCALRVSSNRALKTQARKKNHFTVLATVSRARTQLTLTLLASGKGERCEFSQPGNLEIHWRDHIQAGWTTQEFFIQYLWNLRQYFASQLSIWLMLDLYAAHRTPRVRSLAR
jgi:hypothetical protein